MEMIDKKDFRQAGNVVKAHGLKGELLLRMDASDLQHNDCLMLDMEGLLVPFFVEEWRSSGDDCVLLTLQGVSTQAQIQEVVGRSVYLPKAESDDEVVTYEELVGYQIVYDGNILGTVAEVDDQTENILLVVQTRQGELLLPASPDYVLQVDTEKKVLTMDFPAELLTIND